VPRIIDLDHKPISTPPSAGSRTGGDSMSDSSRSYRSPTYRRRASSNDTAILDDTSSAAAGGWQ